LLIFSEISSPTKKALIMNEIYTGEISCKLPALSSEELMKMHIPPSIGH
jgi:hypothetical protein